MSRLRIFANDLARLVYDEFSGSFTQLDASRLSRENQAAENEPPNNCLACSIVADQDERAEPCVFNHGVSIRGINYHFWDFVYFYGNEGPCEIGYIVDFLVPRSSLREATISVKVKRIGIISSLKRALPAGEMKDEVRLEFQRLQLMPNICSQRHLFMTDEVATLNVEDLISVCYVWPFEGMKAGDLSTWLSLSPDHFYIKFKFPHLVPHSWDEKQALGTLRLCKICSTAKMAWRASMEDFLAEKQQSPLRTLDLFAGSGAFGFAMEETGCIKVTHAIEISPSAAETHK